MLVAAATCAAPILMSPDWLAAMIPLCIILLLLMNLDPLMMLIYQSEDQRRVPIRPLGRETSPIKRGR